MWQNITQSSVVEIINEKTKTSSKKGLGGTYDALN